MEDFKEFSIIGIAPEGIQCFFKGFEIEVGQDVTVSAGILKVKGKYPDGSAGARIGEYVRGVSVFLREYNNLDVLIFDFSDLDYKWGNNLSRVAAPEMLQTSSYVSDTWLGYYIVGSEKNKDALFGLFCEFGKVPGITKIYLSIDEALKDVIEKGKQIYKK